MLQTYSSVIDTSDLSSLTLMNKFDCLQKIKKLKFHTQGSFIEIFFLKKRSDCANILSRIISTKRSNDLEI